MGPTPHLWLLHATQRLQDKIYRSLWVQDRTYGLFAFETATLAPECASLYGSQPSFVGYACKTSTLAPELQVSMGLSPPMWFCAFTTATL